MTKSFNAGLWRYPEGYYVYFITEDINEKAVKIGVSRDPFSRLDTLQTGSSRTLQLPLFFGPWSRKGAFDIEKDLHSRLDSKRIRGEWFRTDYRVCWQFFDTSHLAYFEGAFDV